MDNFGTNMAIGGINMTILDSKMTNLGIYMPIIDTIMTNLQPWYKHDQP